MNQKTKKTDQRDALSIDYDVEPWTRKWCGFMGYHTHKNAIGGAFSKTKHDFQMQMEQRNRNRKLLKQKNQKKH